MYDYSKSELIGRRILSHTFGADEVLFVTDKGSVRWTVDGDCCSESVLTDERGSVASGELVVAVDKVAMADPRLNPADLSAQEQRQDVEAIYGALVRGDRGGELLIVFRNWSNGYYGGSLNEDCPR